MSVALSCAAQRKLPSGPTVDVGRGMRAKGAPSLKWVDCVEKGLCGVGTNFLRAAGAFFALVRGGPLRLERIHSVTFAPILGRHRRPKSAIIALSRKF
jgi:hypothetical protein